MRTLFILLTLAASPLPRAAAQVTVVAGDTARIASQGTQVRTGAGVPSSLLGAAGDVYIDTATGDLYAKAGTTWAKRASLRGPSGTAGAGAVGYDVTADPTNPVPADGVSPAASAFQAIVNGKPAGTVYRLKASASQYVWDRPVFLSEGDSVIGDGVTSSRIFAAGDWPAFVDGVRGTTPGGFAVGSAARPDLFGKLDTSVATATGQAWGFATQGRTIAYATWTPLSLGSFTGGQWNYHAHPKLTLNICWDDTGAAVPPAYPLAGVGAITGPAPFVLAYDPDVIHAVTLFFRCAGDADGTFRGARFAVSATPGVHRAAIIFDGAAGTVSARYGFGGGVPAAVTVTARAPGDLTVAGKTLEPNYRCRPFQVGTAAVGAGLDPNGVATGVAATPFTLCGLRLVADAVGADEGTDALRYLAINGQTVGTFVPGLKDTGRLLVTIAGAAAGGGASGRYGRLLLLDARDYGQPMKGSTVRGLATTNAAPGVLWAGVNGATVEQVAFTGGAVGMASVHAGGNWANVLSNCRFGGTDAPVSLFACDFVASGRTSVEGGTVSVRLIGSGGSWDYLYGSVFGPAPRRFVEVLNDSGYSYQNVFTRATADNEGVGFGDSVFFAENGPNNPAQFLRVSAGACAGLGAGAYTLRLKGYSAGATYSPLQVDLRGFYTPSGGAGAAFVGGATGQFAGDLDFRGSASAAVSGPGYDPTKLSVKGP